ncbi:hypothetical protein [Agrobacterium tumefaciens]|nr:hypothetical protein [Agrobacterium tumefaciens]UXS02123.1 hypothetical protein FY156_11955 [Agrobacterium tumefaciens]
MTDENVSPVDVENGLDEPFFQPMRFPVAAPEKQKGGIGMMAAFQIVT